MRGSLLQTKQPNLLYKRSQKKLSQKEKRKIENPKKYNLRDLEEKLKFLEVEKTFVEKLMIRVTELESKSMDGYVDRHVVTAFARSYLIENCLHSQRELFMDHYYENTQVPIKQFYGEDSPVMFAEDFLAAANQWQSNLEGLIEYVYKKLEED